MSYLIWILRQKFIKQVTGIRILKSKAFVLKFRREIWCKKKTQQEFYNEYNNETIKKTNEKEKND